MATLPAGTRPDGSELLPAEREYGRDRLERAVDLRRIPSALLDRIRLSPTLLLPDGQFEFQRTPNVFPTGRLVYAAAGVAALSTAAAFGGMAANIGGGPYELTPNDAREWKILGGLLSSSAAASVLVQDHEGRRTFAGVTFAAAGAQQFTVPGNGGRVRAKIQQSFRLACSAIANIDFVLWVAEEPDPEEYA